MEVLKKLFKTLLVVLLSMCFFKTTIFADDDLQTLEFIITTDVEYGEAGEESFFIGLEVDSSYDYTKNVEHSREFAFQLDNTPSPYDAYLTSTSLEKGKSYSIKLKNLNVNQTFSIRVSGPNESVNVVEYLCAAGEVQKSIASNGKENYVACKIHDSSNPSSVTDPTMINKIKISYNKAQTYELPVLVEYEHLKGAIAQSCSATGGSTSSETVFNFALTKENLLNKSEIYPAKHSISFHEAEEKQDGITVIEYYGDNITHETRNFSDAFISDSKIEIPIPIEKLLPGELNTFYLCNDINKFSTKRGKLLWKVDLKLDDKYNLEDYKITKLKDNNGNDIEKVVDKIEVINYDDRRAQLSISNSSPSNKEDNFTYELLIEDNSGLQSSYDAYKHTTPNYSVDTMDPVIPNTPYTFSLKNGDFLEVFGIPIGSKYTIKQLKKTGYDTTLATEYNSNENISVTLNEDDNYHIASDINLEVETIYREVFEKPSDASSGSCPPVGPNPDIMPISFGLYWSNRTDDDLSLTLYKIPSSFIPLGDDLAESTLKGAQFTLLGSDGTEIVKETDEEGVVVFSGLDPTHYYVIRETKAPNGYYSVDYMYYYYAAQDGPISNYQWYNNLVKKELNGLSKRKFEKNTNYRIGIFEQLSYVILEVQKFELLDENEYDEPLFQINHFLFTRGDNDPREKEYFDYINPSSFLKPLENVEFIMTLDSDPDNPRYTYKITTNEDGWNVFERELPIQPGESNVMSYVVFYGNYTIKEVNTPEGLRPMKEQHVEIKAPDDKQPDFWSSEELHSVMKVVNVRPSGDLKIQKEVKGESADTNKDFTFTVNLKDENGNTLDKEFKYEGSKTGTIKSGDTITLKHNESITIKYLPENTKYEVIETAEEGYITTVNDKEDNSASGVIVDEKTSEVKFVNSKPDLPKDPPKDPPKEDTPKDPPKKPPYDPPKTGIN